MSNKSSFDKYIEEYRRTPDSVLLDVRTAAEYDEGHVPESINIPLDELEYSLDADPQTRVFVYCRSGSRSLDAVYQARDAFPRAVGHPRQDADYQSAGKPEGGGRESWICT